MATRVLTGSFTATGRSTPFAPIVGGSPNNIAQFNVSLSGTFVATVTLDRSFDNGVTWIVCSSDGAGSAASFTAPISVVAEEPEAGVIYSFNCSAFTSGTATYRMSQ